MARERAPAVAVGVNGELGVAGELQHADEAQGIEARHHAGAAEVAHEVVAALHLREIAGDVEGVHDLLAGTRRGFVDLAHHRAGAGLEGRVAIVGLQLVVLDEIDAGGGEGFDEDGDGLGVEADAGLDDGAEERAAFDAGEAAGSFDAEARAGIGRGEGERDAEIEELDAGELLQFEEVAGDGGEQVGERACEILDRPGEGGAGAEPAARGAAGKGGVRERGLRYLLLERDCLDARGGAGEELGRFAGHGDEGTARLLARHRGRDVGGREGGFDHVVCLDAVAHGAVSRPGNGRRHRPAGKRR